jgi:tetratricopeptide (TPR) repeat protein
VENSEKTGSSQALTQDFNKNDPEYKRLLKEEEVILVSDYDLEPHEVDKAIKAGSDEKKAEKDAAAAMPQLSHYEKWKKRRLEFSSLTSTLFNDFWKDSEVTGIINKTEELKDPESRKKNIESELEAIWDMINKREEKLKNQDDQEKKRFLAEQIKKEKNANLAGDSVIMNSISGLDLDRLMTPEQIRQEKQSEKDDFFKSQKKQMDPKVVLAVKEELKKADNLLKNKRREEALEVCRNAFNMVLEIDESNVEALYNLLLLYEKTGSYDFATLIFFKILTLIDSIKADTELNRMIRAKIMCNVKTIIIQSSVAAYNRMVSDKSNQMGPGILSLKELKKKGFLVTGSKPYELQLNLFDKTVKVDISINDFECHGRGGYAIDSNGYVRCSVHGISSYILMHSTKKHLDF